MNLITKIRRLFCPPPAPAADKKICWKIADCSRPGTAHLRRGRTCEDAVGWFVSGSLLGIAVSDAAGSAPQAALGSALAVRTAIATLKDQHEINCPITADTATQALGFAFEQSVNELCHRAEEIGVERHDLACTLILVVADRNFISAAQVGDGAVVIRDESGDLVCLTEPQTGQFANETVLMGCRPSFDVQVQSYAECRHQSIAVFTDGLQRLALKMPQCDPHGPFFQPLFQRLEKLTGPEMGKFLKEFLDSPRVAARTDDDKSIVTAQFL